MPDDKKQAPVDTDTGQAEDKSGDAHSQTFQVPEKLKGKTAEELAKSYSELEKKLGEQSVEIGDARKKVDDALKLQAQALKDRELLQELTQLIYEDPERIKAVETWYQQKQGKSDSKNSDGNVSKPGDSSSSQNQPMVDSDTRRALQDQIFNDFYDKYGIDKLPQKERAEALKRITAEFADLFDPSGKKSITQIVNERPMISLRKDLDKAYKLSGISSDENLQGALAQAQNEQAAIGGLAGKSVREDSEKLTAAEEQMAKNLGITPEKYLARKKEMKKERGASA